MYKNQDMKSNKNEYYILISLAIIMNIDILYLLYPFYSDIVYKWTELGIFTIIDKHIVRISNTTLSLLSTTTYAIIIYYFYNRFSKIGLSRKATLAFTISLGMILTSLTVLLHYKYFNDLEPNPSSHITLFRLFVWYGARATYMSLISIYISDLNIKKQVESKKQKLLNKFELENSITKYSMLKEQINPHFIFNTINTLNALIQFDDKNTIKYINNISKILNYSTTEKDIALTNDEISIGKSYAHLIKMRYKKNIKFNFTTNESCGSKYIPKFAIQTLLENAIKHNSITENANLEIEVTCKNDYIEVKNNINVKKQNNESTGIGLQNLNLRYLFLANKNINILADDKYFCVQIPYI